ncbi:OCIA domain-containing protein 1-like [Lates japonicus]
MSSTTTGFPEEQQRRGPQGSVGLDLIPTEEEKRLFMECRQESFLYRSGPFSLISMAVTQALIARGILSASPVFGPLPKVVFAGICGYTAGNISYMKTCQEKFRKLSFRQRTGLPQQYSKGPQSELSDPDTQSFDPMFKAAEAPGQMPSHSRDYDYGFRLDPPMDRQNDFSSPASVQSYVEEEEPRRKPILYEDLRLKNRENYEVTLTQKAETLLKSTPEKDRERPKKEVKKNIYGDTWEE